MAVSFKEVKERLVFSSSVEALLLRGLAGHVTPELKQKLRTAVKIDLDKPLLPAYPSEEWNEAVAIVAKEIYPELPPEQAQFKLGERQIFGMEETLLGKAQIALAKLVGPRRSILRMPNNAKSSSNFSSIAVKELSPTLFELVSHPYSGHPHFMLGCMSAAIVIAGGKSPDVKVVSFDRAKETLVLHMAWAG